MKFDKFEDIVAWRKARELVREIYKICKGIKDFGYQNQIQRAAVSIMNNIAEGFERKSNPEFKQFLFIAKASCGEVRSMLYVGVDIGHLTKGQFQKLHKLCCEISKMLSGLIKTL